jgi:hypothetical protein
MPRAQDTARRVRIGVADQRVGPVVAGQENSGHRGRKGWRSGEEIFVGTLDGEDGTFTTTYKFESKWDPDVSTGSEVHGRCQHKIVEGSGTGVRQTRGVEASAHASWMSRAL